MKAFGYCTMREKVQRWTEAMRVLRALTPHQRRRHLDMSTFAVKTECGTMACAAGFCALDSWFHRRGFQVRFDATGVMLIKSVTGRSFGGDFTGPTEAFFGARGTTLIFYRTDPRPVGDIVREIQRYIKELKGGPDADS